MSEIDLARMRREYGATASEKAGAARDPIERLREWLQDAAGAGSSDANAMCLCTLGDRYPSARMVLLRGLDDRGLVFYTSYFSRKGRELARASRAAAVLYWSEIARQVRVEGDVEELAEEESDAYFASRPRGHQIAAWASEQSEVVEHRETLEQRVQDYAARFEGQEVPRPHSWGGYLIRPQLFEFWQGRPNRMHDRIEFTRESGAWITRRLQP